MSAATALRAGDVVRQTGRLFRGLLPGRADWAAARRSPRRDLLAGLTVAVVALPLALAYGVTSGR
ncbi:sodium-independent anion transporter, partial [Micromonospora sp. D75]|nr:sodium-independent anion transporter [Micromonospora sp. D75]